MKFIISEASKCPVDLGRYDSMCKKDTYLHLTSDSQEALLKLTQEFSAQSKNFSYSSEFTAPRRFTGPKTGSGMYPVSQYVMPYLLDQNRAFTLNTKNSTCGGMFICPKTLEVIQQYIKDVFPTAEIFNDTTTGHTNSPSMQ